jgi:hypothetical protein
MGLIYRDGQVPLKWRLILRGRFNGGVERTDRRKVALVRCEAN